MRLNNMRWQRVFGLAAGPTLFLIVQTFLPYADMRMIVAIAVWMMAWWITEAVPIAVTALMPLVLFPMTGSVDIETVSGAYGSKFVFLFLGGFLIALAMEKWQLHRRIALQIVARVGDRPNRIVLGFMLASALLSMWISNTATALMMLPIAMSVIHLFRDRFDDARDRRRFALNMLLGLAYAANCGGIATLIGSPPNVAMAGILSETFNTEISFGSWMVIGLPFSMLLLGAVYFSLTRWLHPMRSIDRPSAGGENQIIQDELTKLGQPSVEERRVLLVFLTTAGLWIFKDLINQLQPWVDLNDSSIGMLGGLLLFVTPASSGKPLLEWDDTQRLPWGILLLFGGGMALANALKACGVMDSIAGVFAGSPDAGLFFISVSLIVAALFLTEVISNLALVLVFVPVVGAIAQGMGIHPLHFALPVTLAASCAFMLPMATPPNAIVFAGGHIKIAEMMRAGLLLNAVSIVLLVLFSRFVIPWWITTVV